VDTDGMRQQHTILDYVAKNAWMPIAVAGFSPES
jgi:hypothetical protein